MKACILAYFCVVIVAFEGMWWWLLNNIGLVLHNQVRGTPHFIIVPMTTGYNIACALLPSLVSVPFYAIPISLSIIHRIFYLLVHICTCAVHVHVHVLYMYMYIHVYV